MASRNQNRQDEQRSWQNRDNQNRGYRGAEDRRGSSAFEGSYRDAYGANRRQDDWRGDPRGYSDDYTWNDWSDERAQEGRYTRDEYRDRSERGYRDEPHRADNDQWGYPRSRESHTGNRQERFGSYRSSGMYHDNDRDESTGGSYRNSGNAAWDSYSGDSGRGNYGSGSWSQRENFYGNDRYQGYGGGRGQSEMGNTGRGYSGSSMNDNDSYSGRSSDYRGKGPKGYQRSDARIQEEVSDRLSDDRHIDASDIEISVQNSEVVLSGTVESRMAKRHAEDLAESISGVQNVENRLKIKREDQSGSQTQGRTKGSSATGNERDSSAASSDQDKKR